ncbi:Uncharacterized membrane protein [Granulicella rosea]|uniref:Uncharacterized membrane protein n=1 Tax=Granulicella rosea TaxID=474952 RepID=A0A239CQ19_9BACT|nr:DoxX family protein [Granulicella rosea]SNS22336.1 Uncharacterized membrane protein [Granulicella rosea]
MTPARLLYAAIFIVAGILHFVFTPIYMKIMPPYLSDPRLLVQISGVAEIAGGVGLLYPPTRMAAAWGIIALLLCVMPANIQMALDHASWAQIPQWALWARLPLQVPLVWWAWVYTRR